MIKNYIYITTQKEFLHQYLDAPEEVWYLKNVHRHVAHIKVKIEVAHEDREIEFIMFKHLIDNYLNEIFTSDLTISCEQAANMLLYKIAATYDREIEITISEDGENGSIVHYNPDITLIGDETV